jgi:iron complex outermembrane receptor protein
MLIALFTTETACAQSPPAPPPPITLPPVVVEGEEESATGPVQGYVARRSASGTKTDTPLIEVPQSITVITRDRMGAQRADSLASALNYTPGIRGEGGGLDTRGYGLQFRGFADSSDSTFYLDGLQLKGTDFASFLPLDPYGAERIEVMRGPGSVLYGQGEPGGLINYVSKRPL